MTLCWHQSTVPTCGAEETGPGWVTRPMQQGTRFLWNLKQRTRGSVGESSPVWILFQSREQSLNPAPKPAPRATFPWVFLPFKLPDSACVPCPVAPSSRPRRGAPLLLSDLCFLPPFLPHTPPPSCFPLNKHLWGPAGGPVIKNPPSNAGDVCLVPGQGTKISQAAEQLSL